MISGIDSIDFVGILLLILIVFIFIADWLYLLYKRKYVCKHLFYVKDSVEQGFDNNFEPVNVVTYSCKNCKRKHTIVTSVEKVVDSDKSV